MTAAATRRCRLTTSRSTSGTAPLPPSTTPRLVAENKTVRPAVAMVRISYPIVLRRSDPDRDVRRLRHGGVAELQPHVLQSTADSRSCEPSAEEATGRARSKLHRGKASRAGDLRTMVRRNQRGVGSATARGRSDLLGGQVNAAGRRDLLCNYTIHPDGFLTYRVIGRYAARLSAAISERWSSKTSALSQTKLILTCCETLLGHGDVRRRRRSRCRSTIRCRSSSGLNRGTFTLETRAGVGKCVPHDGQADVKIGLGTLF